MNISKIFNRLFSSSVSSTLGQSHRVLVGFESLETRTMLSVTINLDYTFDSQGFFDNADAKDAIEDVAEMIGDRLNDSLSAITPGGGNTWTALFTNPGNGNPESVSNPTVAADTITVYVGGQNLGGGTLGSAGPGGWSASGSQSFFDSLRRDQANPTLDFARWGGAATFNNTTNWHFGETTDGLDSNETDFRSVALHELFHVLGFGTSSQFQNLISGGEFTGAATVAEYDGTGNVPVAGTGHFDYGTTEAGQEVALDPDISSGTRKLGTRLDWAALTDIGWEVTPSIGLVYESGGDLVIEGDNDDNFIQVLNSNGGYRVIIDGFDHGVFAIPANYIDVDAMAGDDEVRFQPDVAADGRIEGGAGADILRGGSGDDEIMGGSGNDFLYGRAGDDNLMGEIGNDRLYGQGGNDTLVGFDGIDRLVGGTGNDDLNGGSGDDSLLGNAGIDTLRGEDGDDDLNGGSGNDFLYGGDDDDTINGVGGSDTITGGSGDDMIDGGGSNDDIEGNNGNDTIYGLGGSDTIRGGNGIDTIYGGAHMDFIFGDGDNDFLYGETGVDEIDGGTGDDFIDGGGSNDILKGMAGDDTINGGAGSDTIEGGSDNDTLLGDGGDDQMFGGLGNDTFTGSFGSDLFNGGSGVDTAIDDGEAGEISIENS